MMASSDYEQLRLQNIARNAAALVALGLDPLQLTKPATGTRAPVAAALRKRRLQRAARRSARIASLQEMNDPPQYTEETVQHDEGAGAGSGRKRSRRCRVRGSSGDEKDMFDEVTGREQQQQRRQEAPRGAATRPQERRQRQRQRPSRRKARVHSLAMAATGASAVAAAGRVGKRSCRVMQVDIQKLQAAPQLGRRVFAATTQIKASVMQAASLDGTMPTFSRMSGIQEWDNAIMLFVNVYGGEYKNVFLDSGRQITWFAQSRQWEDTPVIRRLIEGGIKVPTDYQNSALLQPVKCERHKNSEAGDTQYDLVNEVAKGSALTTNNKDCNPQGGEKHNQDEGTEQDEEATEQDEDEEEEEEPVKPAHILLFCRCYQQEYVYCGRLGYVAHDPERLPIRFVWQLLDYDIVSQTDDFKEVLDACNQVLASNK